MGMIGDVYLDGFHVEYPTPRRITIDVALRNGLLDVTSALTDGKIYYESRKIKIDFKVIDNPLPWQKLYSKIARAVHGKSLRVIYDLDPDFYWDAYNCTITSQSQNEDVGSFSIECECMPYKHELEEQRIVRTLWGEGITINVENLREEVVPTINVTAPATLEFEGGWYSLAVGDNTIEDVELKDGTNVLKIYRVIDELNIITIKFRRGDL